MISRTPPSWHYPLLLLKSILWQKFYRKSYSHMGEDLVIDPLARKIKNGFYVDVGAYHPLRVSNTHRLYKKGWRGLNIDPDKSAQRWFTFFRPRDVFLHCGVSHTPGLMTYYKFSDPGFNTFDKERAEDLQRKGNVYYFGEEKIPIRTLRDIFSSEGVGTIDLLDIDTEGIDLEVLQSNEWNRWRPRIIIVEDWKFNPLQPQESKIQNFLQEKGYTLFAYVKNTLIFKRKEN